MQKKSHKTRKKTWTFLRNAAFRATLHHSTTRGTTPQFHNAASRDAAFVSQLLWQIPH
jgi:hypothetical protein